MALPSSFDFPYPTALPVQLLELDHDPVTGAKPDKVGSQAVGHMSQDLDPIRELHTEHPVRQRLRNHAFHEPVRVRRRRGNARGRGGHER